MEIALDEDYYVVESEGEGKAKLDYVFDNFARVKRRHHRTEGKLAFVTPEEREREAERGDDYTYGLILDIHEVLCLIPDVGSYKRFIDLGSGIGRIVLQVFLTTEIEDVLGIEVVESRFEKSREHVLRLSEKYRDYKVITNDPSEIQLLYAGEHGMKTLTILKKNIFDHSFNFDGDRKSIVNSHVLTKRLPEYRLFMNSFARARAFCISMYPLTETESLSDSVAVTVTKSHCHTHTHPIKTDWNTTTGYPFYLTDFNR